MDGRGAVSVLLKSVENIMWNYERNYVTNSIMADERVLSKKRCMEIL